MTSPSDKDFAVPHDQEGYVVLHIPVGAAEALALEVADWLCWTAGVKFATGAVPDWEKPFIPDVDHLRILKGNLQDAVAYSRKSVARSPR